MLTRIRNAARNHAKTVRCLNNKLNRGVAQVLKDEGYIDKFSVIDDGRQGLIDITFRYGPHGERLINSIDRVSKPGCRVYARKGELHPVLLGQGIQVLSTNRGVMSDRRARDENVGGEILAKVW